MPIGISRALKLVREGETTQIRLGGQNINDSDIKRLVDRIINNSLNVTDLQLNGNPISFEGLQHIIRLLNSPECKLQSLDLAASTKKLIKTQQEAFNFAHALKTNKTLTKLSLQGNKIDNACAAIIINALPETCITKLNLYDTPISKTTTEKLNTELAKKQPAKKPEVYLSPDINTTFAPPVEDQLPALSGNDSDDLDLTMTLMRIQEELIEPVDLDTTNNNYGEINDEHASATLERVQRKFIERKVKKIKKEVALEYFIGETDRNGCPKNINNSYLFYTRIETYFEALFAGALIVTGGYISPDKMGKQGPTGLTIKAIAAAFSLVPIVGPFINAALTITSDAVGYTDMVRQKNRLRALFAQLKKERLSSKQLASTIAIALTQRYEYQLMQLPITYTPPTPARAAVDDVLKNHHTDNLVANRLARKVFKHIAEVAIQQDRLSYQKPLEEELLTAYDESFSFIEKAFQQANNAGRAPLIKTKSGALWEFPNILNAPIFICPTTLDTYTRPGISDPLYGFQWVTEATIKQLVIAKKIEFHPIPADKLPALPKLDGLLAFAEQRLRNLMTNNSGFLPMSEHSQLTLKLSSPPLSPILPPSSSSASALAFFSRRNSGFFPASDFKTINAPVDGKSESPSLSSTNSFDTSDNIAADPTTLKMFEQMQQQITRLSLTVTQLALKVDELSNADQEKQKQIDEQQKQIDAMIAAWKRASSFQIFTTKAADKPLPNHGITITDVTEKKPSTFPNRY